MNRHNDSLSYYSAETSFLNSDVTGESVFINPPWKIANECVTHLRECHSRDPANTKAVIVLPEWHTFRESTKQLRLLRKIPANTPGIFTKSPESDGSIRMPVAPAPWPICYWGVDEKTPILTDLAKSSDDSSSMDDTTKESATVAAGDEHEKTTTTADEAAPVNKNLDSADDSVDDDVVMHDDDVAREAASQYLPTTAAYVIMDPDHPDRAIDENSH